MMGTSEQKLRDRASQLVSRLRLSHHPEFGFGTTSCQHYDTAWVSMVTKPINGERQWRFPESFYYLLKHQAADGSWSSAGSSQTGAILDTAAALLSLMKHAQEPLQIYDVCLQELQSRISRAKNSLHIQLQAWSDLTATNHIGVEMIVPALLDYLHTEDSTFDPDFELKGPLSDISTQKFCEFKIESLYGKGPSSALHSLEAFQGKIDFDRVTHHLYRGSMMASPSSTAAFLMNSTSWSEEAEAYLAHIVQFGSGHSDGGIPGTFPTPFFEYSWVLNTLLEAGFSSSDFAESDLQSIADYLWSGFQKNGGIVGFAPRTVDSDDTAKALLTLGALGRTPHVAPDAMIRTFEGDGHFFTFGKERDPSFTSNCHVLLALLRQKEKATYESQIFKATKFLCRSWWNADWKIKDKWHLSHLYPTMLLTQSFIELLCLIDEGSLGCSFSTEEISTIAICLFQACSRTLLEQNENGSWDSQPEQTAFGVLILSQARRLQFFERLDVVLESAVERGALFLTTCGWQSSKRNWVSKTSYDVAFVAEAYHLAALKSHCTPPTGCKFVSNSIAGMSDAVIEGYARLVQRAPLFATVSEWQVTASLLESSFFVPLLQARRVEIFSRADFPMEKDSYLSIIPFTWIGCNNRRRSAVSTSFLYEMMMISMLGYQVDEFMEAVIAPIPVNNDQELHRLIDRVMSKSSPSTLFRPSSMNDQVLKSNSQSSTDDGYSLTADGQPSSSESQSPSTSIDSPRTDGDISSTTGSLSATSDHFSGAKMQVTPTDDWDSGITDRVLMINGKYADPKIKVEGPLQHFVAYVLDHPQVLKASAWDRRTLRQELHAFLHAHASQVEENRRRRCASPPPSFSFFHWVHEIAAKHVACSYSLAFATCLVSSSLFNGEETFPTPLEKYFLAAASRSLATGCRMYNDFGSVKRDAKERNLNSMDFPEFIPSSKFLQNSAESKKRTLLAVAEFEDDVLAGASQQLEKAAREGAKTTCQALNERKLEYFGFYSDVTALYNQLYVLRDLSSAVAG